MIPQWWPPEGAENYYKVPEARKFLETPVHPGTVRWICVLCGCPARDYPADVEVGAYGCNGCCNGCGQHTVRPIDEVCINEALKNV